MDMKTVKVTVRQQDTLYHFKGTNSEGHTVDMDDWGGYESGNGSGATPMELVIMGLAGCTGIDVADILHKQKQQVDLFEMEIVGKKPAGVAPSIYQTVNLSCRFEGVIDEKKVRRAIELSLGKYCSISDLLKRAGAQVSYDFSINGEAFDGQAFSAVKED
jgi:putative redox protein